MRFGGHETFHIRQGWITRGIEHLGSDLAHMPFSDAAVADRLGVGLNMSKSIGYWLQVSGIAERPGGQKGAPLALTPFGRLLRSKDPYLQHSLVWWVVHVHLAKDGIYRWFWNDFRDARFDRLGCQSALERHLTYTADKGTTPKGLQREVSVLLQTYRCALPADDADPEDNLDCPLRHLGLLTLHTDLAQFERREGIGRVPPTALAYTLARLAVRSGSSDITFADALVVEGGPGRLFNLNAEHLAEELARTQEILGRKRLETRLSGGERVIALSAKEPLDFIRAYYKSAGTN